MVRRLPGDPTLRRASRGSAVADPGSAARSGHRDRRRPICYPAPCGPADRGQSRSTWRSWQAPRLSVRCSGFRPCPTVEGPSLRGDVWPIWRRMVDLWYNTISYMTDEHLRSSSAGYHRSSSPRSQRHFDEARGRHEQLSNLPVAFQRCDRRNERHQIVAAQCLCGTWPKLWRGDGHRQPGTGLITVGAGPSVRQGDGGWEYQRVADSHGL